MGLACILVLTSLALPGATAGAAGIGGAQLGRAGDVPDADAGQFSGRGTVQCRMGTNDFFSAGRSLAPPYHVFGNPSVDVECRSMSPIFDPAEAPPDRIELDVDARIGYCPGACNPPFRHWELDTLQPIARETASPSLLRMEGGDGFFGPLCNLHPLGCIGDSDQYKYELRGSTGQCYNPCDPAGTVWLVVNARFAFATTNYWDFAWKDSQEWADGSTCAGECLMQCDSTSIDVPYIEEGGPSQETMDCTLWYHTAVEWKPMDPPEPQEKVKEVQEEAEEAEDSIRCEEEEGMGRPVRRCYQVHIARA